MGFDAVQGSVSGMVEPPKRPEPGTPEYDWLYGESGGDTTDRTRVRPVPPPDEGTRILPTTQPHRQPPPPGTPPPATRRPAVTPVPPAAPAGTRGRRLFRPKLRWLLYAVVLWLVYMVAVPFWAYRTVSTVDAWPSGDRPAEQDGTTYLIVGSDKADDLSEDQRKELRTGPRAGTNTDTIMLLHTGDGPNVLMSIPRDTLVEVPERGTEMINAAFSQGGAKLLVRTVEGLTGIRIDHYVELGFGSIINTVDALGGIEICPKIDMKDPKARLDIEKGCQEVDGMTALAYSRSRHVTARSDLDRVGQQREVISAMGDKVLSPWLFLNPVRYWRFNMAAFEAIRVDDGTGPIDLGLFARAMTQVGGDDGRTCTMPVLPAPESGRLVADQPRADRLFERIVDDDTEDIPNALCTKTGLPKSITG